MPNQPSSDVDIASIVAELMYLRQQGHNLSPDDLLLLDTLDTLERSEKAVKAIVSDGQLSLDALSVSTSERLPEQLGTAIQQWMIAKGNWELAINKVSQRHRYTSHRSGPRSQISTAESVRIPTSPEATKALISIINTKNWTENKLDEQLIANTPSDGLRVNLSEMIGFNAPVAMSHLTRHGASVVQTFLTLASIWRAQGGTAPYDTYVEVFASDILRHQGRQQTPKGGYHQADTVSKGRDVFILSRLVVPIDESEIGGGTKFSRFLSVEQLETKVSQGESESYVRFRFHLGEPFHHWISTLDAGSWEVAGKLLQYHPQRQKYHILLGICLSHIAWRSRYEGRSSMVVPLREILMQSNLHQHGHRPGAFVSSLEDALQDLNRDGILPGVRLNKPDGWMDMPASQQARAILERSIITIPTTLRITAS